MQHGANRSNSAARRAGWGRTGAARRSRGAASRGESCQRPYLCAPSGDAPSDRRDTCTATRGGCGATAPRHVTRRGRRSRSAAGRGANRSNPAAAQTGQIRPRRKLVKSGRGANWSNPAARGAGRDPPDLPLSHAPDARCRAGSGGARGALAFGRARRGAGKRRPWYRGARARGRVDDARRDGRHGCPVAVEVDPVVHRRRRVGAAVARARRWQQRPSRRRLARSAAAAGGRVLSRGGARRCRIVPRQDTPAHGARALST